MVTKTILVIALLSWVALGQVTGKVVSIYDGDTITVLDAEKRQHKIRLAGIDAPERKQDFGNAARRHLSRLVHGKPVTVEGRKIDRYGRRVAKVLTDGFDVNLEMVIAGYAWHYREYEREQSLRDRESYATAERGARRSHYGLWAQAKPTPPWEFRNRTILVVVPPGAEPPRVNAVANLQIVGNRNSKIYHWNPGCPDFFKVSERNRVPF